MSKNNLEKVFDLYLKYDKQAEPVTTQGKVGNYIGSGYGKANGSKLNGDVHWTLFESQGKFACQSNLVGIIKTQDGAEINFDSIGVFRVPDRGKPHLWETAAGVEIATESERYSWLGEALGVWEGKFDMKAYEHEVQVYKK